MRPWRSLLAADALPGAPRVLQDLHLHHAALLLDERRRHVERVLLVELLDDLLGEGRLGAVFEHLLEARVDVGAELDQRLEAAHVLGELVVERRQHALLQVLDVHAEGARLARELFALVRLGELGLDVALVVDLAPVRPTSSSGSTWPDPSSSCTSWPPPSLNSAPSTAMVKSIVSTSPFWAGRADSGASRRACCLRSSSICSVTASSVADSPGRTSSSPSYVDVLDLGLDLERAPCS